MSEGETLALSFPELRGAVLASLGITMALLFCLVREQPGWPWALLTRKSPNPGVGLKKAGGTALSC